MFQNFYLKKVRESEYDVIRMLHGCIKPVYYNYVK